MSSVNPENRFRRVLRAEITGVNRSFLQLLTDPLVAGQAPLLGLNAGVLAQLRRLQPAQLEALAQAPVLLAGFAWLPATGHAAVTPVRQVADSSVPDEWLEHTLRFANRLLTSLWHHSRQADGITTFCVGLDRVTIDWLAALSFSELSMRADTVCASLRARHAEHPACWPDLVATAGAAQADKLAAAHLSLIPLTVAANCSGNA